MAGNRPARERFDFSLDARQVAAVILGSLGALGLAFFLGHTIGQRVADRPASFARAPVAPPSADPLAVLDQAPRPDGGDGPAKFSFHETLTNPRPPQDKLPPGPEPRAAPVAAVAPAESKVIPSAPAAAPPLSGSATVGAASADPVAAPVVAPQPKAVSAPPKPSPGGKGAWVVQVGSTQDRIEADRIAARFGTRGARVVVAEVPGKGRWFRVRLGAFETRESADRYLRDLERATGTKGFVTTAN